MDIEAKKHELAELRDRARTLEAEIATEEGHRRWPPKGFYAAYYANSGFLLGSLAAAVSLLANVIGAPIAGKSPLELIRVYLTFPLGEKALLLAQGGQNVTAVGDGVVLAAGCCLYLVTGMVLGVPFFVLLTYLSGDGSVAKRLAIATVLALSMWIVHFYGILWWLQPMLVGDRWILDQNLLPWWVAAGAHLVFGWTLALLYPLGAFRPAAFETET